MKITKKIKRLYEIEHAVYGSGEKGDEVEIEIEVET